MPSPTILLASLILAIGLFGSGISIGYKWSERAHLAAVAAAQDTAIKSANAATEAEIKRSVAAAKAEADARITASQIRNKGELDALRKSRAACARDLESLGLLNDAIRNANGQTTAASVVFNPVRPAAGPAGWLGTVGEKLGIQSGGVVRSVPTPAR